MSNDTITFPYPFVAGFMGFETEFDLMADFHASCRDSGLKRYAKTYAELCETQNRPMAEPKSFVPTVTLANEGGEPMPNNGGDNATYEGPKDLDYAGKKFGKVPGTRNGRGFVHGMTEPQMRFARSLLAKKDTSNLRLLKGWTLNPNELHTISKQHARSFIDALLSCPDKKAANDSGEKGLSGSPKQIEWITLGLNGKPSLLKEKGFITETDISTLYKRHNYSAKQIIDALLKLPRKLNTEPTEEITEGAYWFINDKGERLIARVQRTKNGAKRLYAKLQTEVGGQHFEYEPGLIRKLKAADKLNLSEMQQFAAQYSQCADCGTHMTNPISIARGVGPVCSGKGYTL